MAHWGGVAPKTKKERKKQTNKQTQINLLLESVLHNQIWCVGFSALRGVIGRFRNSVLHVAADTSVGPPTCGVQQPVSLQLYLRPVRIRFRVLRSWACHFLSVSPLQLSFPFDCTVPVHRFWGAVAYRRKTSVNFVMSASPSVHNLISAASTRRISVIFFVGGWGVGGGGGGLWTSVEKHRLFFIGRKYWLLYTKA